MAGKGQVQTPAGTKGEGRKLVHGVVTRAYHAPHARGVVAAPVLDVGGVDNAVAGLEVGLEVGLRHSFIAQQLFFQFFAARLQVTPRYYPEQVVVGRDIPLHIGNAGSCHVLLHVLQRGQDVGGVVPVPVGGSPVPHGAHHHLQVADAHPALSPATRCLAAAACPGSIPPGTRSLQSPRRPPSPVVGP